MGKFHEALGDELELYVRQLAWLRTAPTKAKPEDPDPETHGKQMADRGEEILLPPNSADHITDWLFDVGPSKITDMGEYEIGYPELVAWQTIHGIELPPWEAQLLIRLSRAYVTERHRARKPNAEAPYIGEKPNEVAVEEKVSRQVSTLMGQARDHLRAKALADQHQRDRKLERKRLAKAKPTK